MDLTPNIQKTIRSDLGQERQTKTGFGQYEPSAHGKDQPARC